MNHSKSNFTLAAESFSTILNIIMHFRITSTRRISDLVVRSAVHLGAFYPGISSRPCMRPSTWSPAVHVGERARPLDNVPSPVATFRQALCLPSACLEPPGRCTLHTYTGPNSASACTASTVRNVVTHDASSLRGRAVHMVLLNILANIHKCKAILVLGARYASSKCPVR